MSYQDLPPQKNPKYCNECGNMLRKGEKETCEECVTFIATYSLPVVKVPDGVDLGLDDDFYSGKSIPLTKHE